MWAKRRPLTVRSAVLGVMFFCAISAAFFVVAARRSADADRVRHARTCDPKEYFSSVPCQVRLIGRLIHLTHSEARVRIQNRRLAMPVQLGGDLSGADGEAVDVTLWQGRPIHIVGPSLKMDAANSAFSETQNYRIAGVFCLVAGPVLVGLNLLIGGLRGRRST